MTLNKIAAFTLCFLLFLTVPKVLASPLELDIEAVWERFIGPEHYFTMVDNEGNILMQTGHWIYLDDQYLTADNKLFEVVSVDEEHYMARAELIEEVELEHWSFNDLKKELGISVIEAQEEQERGTIGVYHTHNAESYVPTDGTDSVNGKGGIHQVGAAFVKALESLGVNVEYSEKLHLPHDRGAYRRSRNTVLEILSKNPDAIFDVHRDAAPPGEYALQLGNEWITSIQFVVGRQNQNLGINRKFAQSIKKIGDQMYPGLIKGIFYGRGNYNQDLTPLSLLLEAGAHTNSRDAAERGIGLFSEVVDLYFYGPKAEAKGYGSSLPQASGAARRSITGLILFVFSGVVIFYVINAGGFRAAWERFKGLLRLK